MKNDNDCGYLFKVNYPRPMNKEGVRASHVPHQYYQDQY